MRAKLFYILFFLPIVAASQCSPGNVSNLYVWLKADAGINSGAGAVNGWLDQSGRGQNLDQSLSTSRPAILTSGLNYNPLIRFDGVDDFMRRSGGILSNSSPMADFYVYMVTKTNSTSNDQYVYTENGTGSFSPRIAGIVPQSNLLMYQDFGDNVNGRLWVNWTGIGNTSDYFIWSLNTSTTISTPSGANKAIYRNGGLVSNSVAQTTMLGNNSTFYMGSQDGSVNFFNGDIAELIVFNRIPTTNEQRQIHSYLAIKYGIGLYQGTPQDYLASDGATLMWTSAKANNTYINNIAGIGRDNNSCLHQKQSQGWGDILTIGLTTIVGSNALNTSSFTNLTFQTWGNDNGTLGLQYNDLPSGTSFPSRIKREWKIQETGTIGAVSVQFDISSSSIVGNSTADFGLLVDLDGDGDFTTGSVTSFAASSFANNTVTFSNINFQDQQVFTLATFNAGPGGISNNLRLWLRADKGVYADVSGSVPATQGGVVRRINDLSLYTNDAVQSGTIDASYNVSNYLINYNPTIYFYSSSSTSFNINLNSITNSNYTLFGATSRSAANNESYILGIQGSTFYQSLHFGYRTPNLITLDHYGQTIDQSVAWYNAPYSPAIISGSFSTSTGMTVSEQRGGVLSSGTSSTATIPLSLGSGQAVVGKGYGVNGFLGDMTELIVYNRTLTALEQQKVSSYLAIKNGITLSQSSPTDYLSSDGTKIWNASISGIYKFDICVIGRDDASRLNQLQSKSSNASDLISIGLSTIASSNLTNPNSFTSDVSFMSWANDNGALAEQSTELPSNGNALKRLTREWKIQETGTVSNVQVVLDLTSYTFSGVNAGDYNLMIDTDNDGDFTTGTITYLPANTYSNRLLTFSNVNFTNGNVFTFGTQNKSPGGVAGDIFWIKADAGVTGTSSISGWSDQSGNNNNLSSTATSGPSLVSGGLNFNPIVAFNGTSQYLRDPSGIFGTSTVTDMFAYVVSRNISNATSQTLFIERTAGSASTRFSGLMPWTDGSIIYDFGDFSVGGRVASAWGGNFTNHFIWSLNSSTNTATPSGQRKAFYRNGRLVVSNNNIDFVVGNNSPFYFGGDNNFSFFNGTVAECVLLNKAPSAADQNKIQSYLAIKYGITIDQTTPTSYFASDGTTLIWDASAAGLYKNNIAGIGRDDNSGLAQKQSKSQVTNEFLSIGLGTIAGNNQSNPNTFSSNLSFLSWAHNNGSILEQSTEMPVSGGGLLRIGREWRVYEIGTISGLQISFDLSLLTVSGIQAQDFSLLVDSDGDGDFTTGAIASYPASSLSSNQLIFNNINFSDGDYFTLSTFRRSPGGVAGTLLWLDATRGITGTSTVSAWADQSGNVKDMSNGINSTPQLNPNSINFNPSIDFDGIKDYMSRAVGILGTSTYPEFNTYIVSRTLNISSNQIILFEVTNNTGGTPKFSIQLPISSGILQYDAGNGQTAGGGRVSANWGGNTSNFYLWSLNSSIGTGTPSGSQKAIYSNGLLLGSNSNAFTMRGNNSPFYLSSFTASTSSFNGQIAEMIMVNKTVSGFEQKKIESYLALKYGITIDQTTPTNYIASNGSVIWNGSVAGAYKNNIAGVGRDDLSGLLQKQSKSNASTEILSLGIGTITSSNSLNSNTISSDLSFLVWANDNGALLEQTTEIPTTTGCLKRLTREWKVKETGTIGNCQLALDISTLTLTGTTTNDFNLMVDQDGDGDFTTGAISYIKSSSLSGNLVTFNNINFNDGNVFTFTTSSVSSVSMGGTISTTSLFHCIGGNSGTLTLSGYNGSILNWESSTNNFATTQTISNTAFTNPFNNLTVNTSFRARVQNSVCPSTVSGVIALTTVGISVGGSIAGVNSPYCTGSNAGTLTLSGVVGNVLLWQSSANNFATIATISNTAFFQSFTNLTTTTGYRAIVQNSVCPSTTSGAFTVSVVGISVGGTVSGPNFPVCASANSGTLTLSGFVGSIQKWQSSNNNFVSVTDIASVTSTIVYSNLTTSTSFRAIAQNGLCSTVTSSVFTVTVNGISIGGTVSGPNLAQCTGTNNGTLTLAGFNGNIQNWQSSTDNFATITTISSITSTIGFSNLTTTTSYRAIIQNGVCSTVASSAFTVTVNGLSIGGTVSGPNLAQCAGANNGTLTVGGFSGNIQFWQSSTNNFATITTISSITSTIGFSNLITTTSFRAIIQNGVCSTVASSAFTITVNGVSIGGTVSGPNLAQCSGTNNGTLTLAGFNGNIQNWQSSTDNFATVTTISSITSTIGFSNLTTTTSFRAIIQNGVCSTVASSAFTVTVNGISIGGTVSGPNLTQCSGVNNGTLTLAGFNGNIQFWQSSTNNFATITTISSITSTIGFSNLITTTSFRAIIQNGVCSTVASSAFTITVNGVSIGGTVSGPNLAQCAGANNGTLTLSGFSGNIQNWQSSTDNFTTFTQIASTTSNFSFNNLTTSTSFRAIVQNGACSTVTSTAFTITVNGISLGGTVNGTSFAQCAGANSGTLTLSGFNGNIQNWQSSTNNFTTFSSISSTTSSLPFSNLITTTSFRAVVQNGACATVSSGAFTVTVNGLSVGGTVSGPLTAYCSGANTGTLTLAGFVGVIQNWQLSTDNFATSIAISSTSSSLIFSNLTSNTSFKAIVQNGACSTVSSSSFTVTVNGLSLGGTVVGTNAPQCTGSNAGTLTLSGFNGAVQNWQSSTDNFASILSISSTTAFFGFANLTTTTSYRAIVQNGACSTVPSSLFTITVNGISIGGSVSGPTSPVCAGGNNGTLTLSGYSGSIRNWQTSNDNFTSVTNVSSTTSSFIYLNITTSTSYRAIIQNGSCATVTSNAFTISVSGISTGGTVSGVSLPYCASLNSGTLTLSGYLGSVINWQSSIDNFATSTTISSPVSILGFNNLTTSTGYRAIVQNGSCSTIASTSFTVTINGISLGGNAVGPSFSQCLGSNNGTVSITGYVGNVLSWEMSVDNFSNVSPIASTTSFINFSNLSTTTSYRALVQNGVCSSTTSSAFTVTVGGISVGGSINGPSNSLCTGSNGILTLTGFIGNILGWQSSVDNFTSVLFISSTTSTLPFINLTTTTSYRALVQNGACASSSSVSFTVSVNGISVGGSVTGPSLSFCANANSGTMTLSGYSGNILTWESSTDNFSTILPIASTNSFFSFNNLSTTTSFRALIQNGGCSSVASSAFTITVNGISVGGTVSGPSNPLCSGSNSGTLTVNGFVGNILSWESSLDNFSTATPISSTTPTLPFLNITTSTSYRIIAQNGACATTNSAPFTITVSGVSVGGTINGPTVGQCSGVNSGTLTLSGYSGNIISWESSTDNFATTTAIASTIDNIVFSNLSTTTSFRAFIQNGSCSTATSTSFTVSVSGVSIGGIITGPPTSQCSNSNLYSLTLSGFNGSVINWESSSDNFSTVVPISSTTSNILISNILTTNSFRAIVQNGACSTVQSAIYTATIDAVSFGGNISGPLNSQCSSNNLGDLTLSGFNGAILNWESSLDNFITSNIIASTTSTITYNQLSTTTSFRANIQNGSCAAVSSTSFTITIDGISIGGNISGPSSNQCSGSNLGDLTLSGYNGNILSWESSIDNFLTSNFIGSTLPIITFTNITSTSSFRANVQNGNCSTTSSALFTVTVDAIALGGAITGPTSILCGSGNSGTLTLTGYNGTISNWESSTDNFITTQQISNTTPFESFSNLGLSTSYRANIFNGSCSTLSSGIYTITISSPTLGGTLLGSTSTVCSGTNSGTISITGYNGSIINWESSVDNFNSSNVISNTFDNYTFSNISTTTSFRAILQSGSCNSTISGVHTIFVAPNSSSGIITGPSAGICSGSNFGTLTLTGFVGAIVNWESSVDNFATSTIINQTNPTLDFNNLLQTTDFRAVVQNGNCPASISTPFSISLSSGSAGVVSGPLVPLCITNTNGTLTLTGFSAPISRWESSIDNTTFTSLSSSLSQYSFSNLTTTTSFRAIVQSGSCPEIASNVFTVVVSQLPKPGSILGGSILPLGANSGTLQLTNYSGQIVSWEESSDSLMTNPSIISNTSSQQTYNNISITKFYRATVSTPSCPIVKSNSAGIIIQLLVFYSGFSPDGDGKNDTWVIENIQLYPNNSVKIYNRWGNLVYQESGYDNVNKVWKGNSNTGFVIGGDALPEGTYYYVITINGNSEQSGYLLLNK